MANTVLGSGAVLIVVVLLILYTCALFLYVLGGGR